MYQWSSEKLNEYGEIVSESISDNLQNIIIHDTLKLWKNRDEKNQELLINISDISFTIEKEI